MIEILNIIFLIFSIQWICSISYFSNNLFNYRLSNLEKVSFNLSLLLNIFLFFSFYKLNQQYIFLLFLILPFIDYLFNKNKIFTESTIFLIFFTFVLSISISSNLILEWDAAALWIYKTINFLNGENFSNLSEVPGTISYPHLGPYIWSFFWKNSFVYAEYTGRIFYIFIYCLSVLLIIDFNKKDLFKKILLASGFFIISLDYYLHSGYQEYLVFSILIFIFYFYFKYFENKKIIFLIPTALFINTIIWMKNEASFFVLFFLFFVFFHHFIKKEKIKIEIIALSLLFFLAVLIKYLVFFNTFNEINVGWDNYAVNNFGNIFQFGYFIERTPTIVISIFVALIKCKTYLIFFLAIYFYLNKKLIKDILPYLFFLILNLLLIYFIYYLTNDSNWGYYLATTVDRLLFQTSGIYLLPIFFILKKNTNL